MPKENPQSRFEHSLDCGFSPLEALFTAPVTGFGSQHLSFSGRQVLPTSYSCAGTKVPFLAWTRFVRSSFVGNPATQRRINDLGPDLDASCWMTGTRITYVARPAECCTCWPFKVCRSWRARGSRRWWPLRVWRKICSARPQHATTMFVTKERGDLYSWQHQTPHSTIQSGCVLRSCRGTSPSWAKNWPLGNVRNWSWNHMLLTMAGERCWPMLTIRPGDTTFMEVLECPGTLRPTAVLVQDRSLYVSMSGRQEGGLYEYVLPLELQLKWKTRRVMCRWPHKWCFKSSVCRLLQERMLGESSMKLGVLMFILEGWGVWIIMDQHYRWLKSLRYPEIGWWIVPRPKLQVSWYIKTIQSTMAPNFIVW